LPPLRNRLEDLPLLVQHFVSLLSEEMGIPQPKVSKEFVDALSNHPFPGNIRELRNILERTLIDARGNELGVEHLPVPAVAGMPAVSRTEGAMDGKPVPGSAPEELSMNLKELEGQAVRRALELAQGNMSAAARHLGIGRTRLYRILAGGSSKP
jgi:DNA-binding NtrC family response regulator